MAQLKGLHWGIPSLMLLTLLCGILLALGHHLFYQSLNGKPTSSTGGRGTQQYGQQFNIAIGTAFAFLVKASFVVSVTTAYYQLFWKAAKRVSKSGSGPTLGSLDATFSGTNNLVSLLNVPLWFRYPLLFVVALFVWLIPIASIITPSTLSVALRENVANSTWGFVPQIDFDNLNFVAAMPGDQSGRYDYKGSSQITQQIATAVAAQNDILPITAPHPNSSWSLDFQGPALKCEPLPSDRSMEFQRNIGEYIRTNCFDAPTFLAWYPRRLYNEETEFYREPYYRDPESNITSYIWKDPGEIFVSDVWKIGQYSPDTSLYIAVMPHLLEEELYEGDTYIPKACLPLMNGTFDDEAAPELLGEGITMIRCQLYNSTYRTEFSYVNGQQDVKINITHQPEDSVVPIIGSVIGKDFVGVDDIDNCAELKFEKNEEERCRFDRDLLSQLSYQSVLNAFSNLVTGNITFKSVMESHRESTRIRSTSLTDTKELRYLSDYERHMNSYPVRPDLQYSFSNSTVPDISGLARLKSAAGDKSLEDALEKMFQNITISLMSSAALQPNYSSLSPPAKTNITTFTAQTVYSYNVVRLWAAYGTACLAATLCVIIGLVTIIASGASYDNTFSTVFRVARASKLSNEIIPKDMDGKSPLPSYLAKTEVVLVEKGEEQKGSLLEREG